VVSEAYYFSSLLSFLCIIISKLANFYNPVFSNNNIEQQLILYCIHGMSLLQFSVCIVIIQFFKRASMCFVVQIDVAFAGEMTSILWYLTKVLI
jgi:hypothetical protein